MQDLQTVIKKRRAERIALTIPVRVEGKKSLDDGWSEISRFQTVSPVGAGFILEHAVTVGQLVMLTAPLPQKLRRYDFSEQQYRVWALIRYCNPYQDVFEVGVAFLGKNPPPSYLNDPAAIYDLAGFDENGLTRITECHSEPTEPPPDERKQRRHTRYSIPVEISIEKLDRDQKATDYEITVSENISVAGAAVFASFDVSIGDLVRLNFLTYNISILAKVCNRRVGADGMPRLHLEFIDRRLPLEGIE